MFKACPGNPTGLACGRAFLEANDHPRRTPRLRLARMSWQSP
jgi:hypothetical protein